MIGTGPAPPEYSQIRYVDKVSITKILDGWGPPPNVKKRSRGAYKHACWIGSVDGEQFLSTLAYPQSRLRMREMANVIKAWCEENLTARQYSVHQAGGRWHFRILLVNDIDALRVKMRWGSEQFAHVEFREPLVVT